MTSMTREATVGVEHWLTKQHSSGPIRLFAWEKFLPSNEGTFSGTVLLVHGSSMASTPTFDLQVPGYGDEYSLMDTLARAGRSTSPLCARSSCATIRGRQTMR